MAKVRELLFGNINPYEGLDVRPFNSHGWASENPAFLQYLEKVKPNLIVEVGTWLGGSARNMANICRGPLGITDLEVVCIDTFLGSVEMWTKESYLMPLKNGRPTVYEEFLSNNIHCGLQDIITPFPVDSQNGFLTLQKWNVVPDFVYIDAGHDYYSVKNDLEMWSSIIRPGGVLLGDDWHHPPIKRAAFDVFGEENVIQLGAKFAWVK
jgi:hypothetical protein